MNYLTDNYAMKLNSKGETLVYYNEKPISCPIHNTNLVVTQMNPFYKTKTFSEYDILPTLFKTEILTKCSCGCSFSFYIYEGENNE